jgi:hypothetical protein
MCKKVILVLGLVALALSACQAATPSPATPSPVTPSHAVSTVASDYTGSGPVTFPKIDRHPAAADYYRGEMTAVPTYNPDSGESWQMDLRSYDLSKLDLRGSLDDLLFATFDSRTVWPAAGMMPEGFDWQGMMDLGKNPGLGLRSLHDEGITGTGIGIAIIDQTLLVDHQEYKDRIRLYEETGDITGGWMESQMHGPAVASIAVGKTVGVAPEADLYFIATAMCSQGTYESNDFACLAKAVRRIIEINAQLPADRKIRVLSMSVGWSPDMKGYEEITAAVEEAQATGLLVVSSTLAETAGSNFIGLGRAPLADPDAFESYEPGLFWAKSYFQMQWLHDTLLVPMDSRTTASPTGVDEYVFYREGGLSWAIPYIAGVYTLAAQVKPDITPDLFWSTARQTGKTIEITHEGQKYSLGIILDPVALIHALQEM